jgi:SAM-dependent methyltransferase
MADNILKKMILTRKIPSVTRITLDRVLKIFFRSLKKGKVVDLGSMDSPYKKFIPYTEYLRVDIDAKNNPDICCDFHKVKWKSNYFDTAVATEILEHSYNPQKAVDELRRILKKGGVCILSTRFIQQYHPCPKDYFRFSKDGLEHLFRKFNKVKIIPHGNRFLAIWTMINCGRIGLLLNLLNYPLSIFSFKDSKCPLGFVVYAIK